MKKIFLLLIVLLATLSVNAQVIKVYENGTLSATYTNTETQFFRVVFEEDASSASADKPAGLDKEESAQLVKIYVNGEVVATYVNTATNTVEVFFEEAAEPEPTTSNLLPGKFTVDEGKQVQFTKANLYWDGSDFRFEANQTDYPTVWDANHVGHFFWEETAAESYAATNGRIGSVTSTESTTTFPESFFADGSDAEHMLTVEGTSGLYALSAWEWMQFLNHAYQNNLIRNMVTVFNGEKTYEDCVVIAPDGFTGEWKESYTLEELNAAGLLCLPPAGYRDGSSLTSDNFGYYWSSSQNSDNPMWSPCFYFNTDGKIDPTFMKSFFHGCSIRLVADAEASDPEEVQLVTAITVTPSSLSLTTGESAILHAAVSPLNADNQYLRWKSDNEEVVTVADSIVTAVGPGTATITCVATDGSGVTGICVITVTSADTPTDAHDYVDLGLPSGTLWATCNVGANSPEDYGDFFAWGETTGYNSDDHSFDWENYKWCNGSETTMTKYCKSASYGTVDNKSELEPADDAATANWGSDWQMPSFTQIEELYNSNYTTTTWTKQNNVRGLLVTSNTNGNSIFLPAAGCYNQTSHNGIAMLGCYWTRTLYPSRSDGAYILEFYSTSADYNNSARYCGRSVRPVLCNKKEDAEKGLVTSITVMPASLKLTTGVSAMLMAAVEPADADNQTLIWSSSDEKVATVVDGEVTAVAPGTATITCAATDGSGVTGTCVITVTSADVPTTTDANLLSGKFSVSASKNVQFTKGNLYWDGSDFKFESHQMDYPTEWDESHVGHFYWTTTAAASYAESYSGGNESANGTFWCGEENPLTVEGTSGLYALSSKELNYLLYERPNAENLYTFGATVIDEEMNYITYLIIAPDDFTGGFPLDYTYSINELNALNFVCLPGAGVRIDRDFRTGYGNYWTATPNQEDKTLAYGMCSDPSFYIGGFGRGTGCSIRLVKDAEATEPSDPKADQLVTAITLSQSTLSVPVSSTILLSATVSPSNATKPYLKWTSSDESVAVAYDSIIVTKAVGTAIITCAATDGSGVTATCTIMVYDPDAKDNSGSIDGRDYVDLGLPSGTMWATCNVGATSPEGYGEYFAWGETTGSGSGRTVFDWEQYKLCNNGEADQLNKYCTNSKFGTVDNKTELEVEDDAAYVNWGSNWRIPSLDQLNEMLECCTWTWTAHGTVNGYEVTGTNGNSIFLPAAGLGSYTGVATGMGTQGSYWTRTLNLEGYSDYAYHYGFTSEGIGNETACRFNGLTIRPVLNTQSTTK